MASVYNILIDQGASFSRTITWNDSTGSPVNLNGYSARMQIRENVYSTSALITLNNNNGIALGGSSGTIKIDLTDSQTGALPAILRGVYDLELISGAGIVTRLLQGTVSVYPQVTR